MHLDACLVCLPLAQGGRMHPATLGEKQPAMLKANPGVGLGLILVKQV
jgi:hypothetical protein